ncbi:hypothetical protein OJAV_G00121020 [Oryzias javanicus]|uniref:Uncharacterized protein n=1 Tax=Oryzias javanicus TaxID=123683 RepID=A0A437CSN2_ORYJA|nr:hypothetical protein OJAV_G00121020 [Oryzias javanicus]
MRAPPSGFSQLGHDLKLQFIQHATVGGAAEARGQCGENKDLPGSCRAPTVLSAERQQGRFAGRSPHRQQPVQGASILRCGVKRKKTRHLTQRKKEKVSLI